MKKILTLVFALCLVLTLSVFAVSAEDTNVAKLGDNEYATLQAALDACTAGNNTITLLGACDEDVTVKQVAGVNVTIDGANNEFSGTIYIHGNARYTGAETLTIKNIKFVTAETTHDFISSNSTGSVERYAHNVTVDNCTFAGPEGNEGVVAFRFRQSYNIVVSNCEATNMHSLLWATGVSGIDIIETDVTNSLNGISVGTSIDVNITGCDITATAEGGYGVRADASVATTMTVEGCNITADRPVILRNTTADYTLNLSSNTLTTDGDFQVVVTKGDDDETYVEPESNFVVNSEEKIAMFPDPNFVPSGRTFKIAYRLYINGNVKATYNATTVTTGESFTLKSVANIKGIKNAGYTFAYWNNGKHNGGDYTFEDGVTLTAEEVNNLYLTADDKGYVYLYSYWTANTDTPYKVQHLLWNATGDKVYKAHATYTFKGTTNKLTEAVALTNIPGYTADEFEQVKIAGDGTTMVKIYYSRNDYTLTYDLAGGTFEDGTATEQTVQYYKKLVAPTAPVKEGYVFAGWDTLPERMPANDLTVVAIWTPAEGTPYKVEHYKGEELADTQDLNGVTDALTAAEAMTYEGYTAQAFEQVAIAADGSTVVKIYYTVNTYNITVESENGTVTAPETAKYGETVEIEVEADYGYEVAAIYVNGEEIEGTSFVMPAADVTIEVAYNDTIPSYFVDIEVIGNGTVTTDKDEYEAGEIVTIDFQLPGGYMLYSLEVVDANGKSVAVKNYQFVMPAGGATVYAEFAEDIPLPAKVYFEANVALEGADLEAGLFQVELSYLYKDSIVKVQTLENNADGKIEFAPVSFYSPGEHTFYIKQVACNAEGVEYDTTVYEIKVKVAYDKAGVLTATVAQTAVDFVNTAK